MRERTRERTRGRGRAAAVAVVLVLVGVLLGSAYAQWVGRREAYAGGLGTVGAADRVRVEVLNAGGVAGLAREATDRLRDEGFDVVFFGNAGTFGQEGSVVLDRVGMLEPARAVADALGIRNVRSEPDSNLYLDVSVLLGSTWSAPTAEPGPSGTGTRSWWDPRGWIGR